MRIEFVSINVYINVLFLNFNVSFHDIRSLVPSVLKLDLSSKLRTSGLGLLIRMALVNRAVFFHFRETPGCIA